MDSAKVRAEEIGIPSILAVAWRRRLLIGAFTGLSLVVALALLMILNPRYTASVAILLDPKGPDMIGTDGEFTSRPVDSVKVGSVVSVIQSNELLDRVVKTQRLTTDPQFLRSSSLVTRLRQLLRTTVAVEDDSESARVARASEVLRNVMNVTRDGFTYIIKIDVTLSDASKAKKIAQAIADAYLDDQLDAKYGAARRDLKWLAERLDDMMGELIASEETVEKVRRAYALTETDRGTSSIASQQITELNNQLILVQADLAQKKARAELVESMQASGGDLESLPEVAASSSVAQLKAKYAQTLSEVAEVSQRFGLRHPQAIKADNERHLVEMQVVEEVKRVVANIRNDYEAAVNRERFLQDQLTKLADQEGKGADGRGRLRQAQSVAQANRQLYDALLNRYKEVEQKQTMQEVEARIISPALLPTNPSFPRPAPFFVIALGLGVVLGSAAALLFEQLDKTFTTPAQIERWLGVPVLASVPKMLRGDLTQGAKRLSILEYTAKHPLSRYAESLRSIRAGLCDDRSSETRVVQFTSPMPTEGKSTLAACVGISAAMGGMRTILIDCDFRNPSASEAFQCQKRVGVGDLLLGLATFEEVLVATQVSSLSIVPAGSIAQVRPDLMNLRRLKQIVLSALEVADFVIIDSAPTEAVADAVMISQIVDRTLIVVKWGFSDRALIERTIDRIQRAQGRLAGIVLNLVDLDMVTKYGYWSKSYMREIGGYYNRSQPPTPVWDTVSIFQRYSGAVAIGIACLAYIFGAPSLR